MYTILMFGQIRRAVMLSNNGKKLNLNLCYYLYLYFIMNINIVFNDLRFGTKNVAMRTINLIRFTSFLCDGKKFKLTSENYNLMAIWFDSNSVDMQVLKTYLDDDIVKNGVTVFSVGDKTYDIVDNSKILNNVMFLPFVNFIGSPFSGFSSVSCGLKKKEFIAKIYAKNVDHVESNFNNLVVGKFVDECKNALDLKYLKSVFDGDVNDNNINVINCGSCLKIQYKNLEVVNCYSFLMCANGPGEKNKIWVRDCYFIF